MARAGTSTAELTGTTANLGWTASTAAAVGQASTSPK